MTGRIRMKIDTIYMGIHEISLKQLGEIQRETKSLGLKLRISGCIENVELESFPLDDWLRDKELVINNLTKKE
jgi:hypothetical protein